MRAVNIATQLSCAYSSQLHAGLSAIESGYHADSFHEVLLLQPCYLCNGAQDVLWTGRKTAACSGSAIMT